MNKAKGIAFTNPKGGSGNTASCLSITGYMVKSIHKVFASDKVVVPFEPSGIFFFGKLGNLCVKAYAKIVERISIKNSQYI